MAQPLAKRPKIDDAPSPIIFESPGFQSDTRLMVFNTEFHVHSTILKIHSAFFRKSLDYLDRTPVTAPPDANSSTILPVPVTPGKFKYKFVTKLDEVIEDGENNVWRLVAASGVSEEAPSVSNFRGNKKAEQAAFEKLLCAFYNRSYTIDDTDELEKLTTLADYYRALSILSFSLDRALMNSLSLCLEIPLDPCKMLELATKLRNALLFREALIWVVGPHSCPQYKALTNSRLQSIARCAYGEISDKIVKHLSEILLLQNEPANNSISKQKLAAITKRSASHYDVDDGMIEDAELVGFPTYFRALWAENNRSPLCDAEYWLEDLLCINLRLIYHCNEAEPRIAGALPVNTDDYFLCARIADQDLPWAGLSEIEW